MCRLLGVLSAKNVNATWVRQFRELAKTGITLEKDGKGHQDGWGIVCYTDRNPIYLGREPASPFADQKYDMVIRSFDSGTIRTRTLVGHLRRAPKGSEISLNNTPPFIYGQWTFCMNGSTEGFEPPLNIPLKGTTSGEKLFNYMLPGIIPDLEKPEEKRIMDSVRDAKKFMKSYKALNFIIANGEKLLAYRDVDEKNASGYLYTLKYCRTEDNVVVCSEPLTVHNPEKDWDDIKNGQMLIADSDLKIRFLQI